MLWRREQNKLSVIEKSNQPAIWVDASILEDAQMETLPGFCNSEHRDKMELRKLAPPCRDLLNISDSNLGNSKHLHTPSLSPDMQAEEYLKLDQIGKAGQVLGASQLVKLKVSNAVKSRWRIIGRKAFDVGDYDLALFAFSKLSVLDPEHPWAWKYLRKLTGLVDGFEKALIDMDSDKPKKRLFVTGCGRSGTWLMTILMASFRDIAIIPRETDIGNYAWVTTAAPSLLLKRSHDAWKYFKLLPASIAVIHMVRHPFSVLTSSHLGNSRHIKIERYVAEMEAMFNYIYTRPNTIIVRYESLIQKPDFEQKRIAELFGLHISRPFSRFHEQSYNILPNIVESMGQIRPIDSKAVDKWKKNQGEFSYLEDCLASYPALFKKISSKFDYDLKIPSY